METPEAKYHKLGVKDYPTTYDLFELSAPNLGFCHLLTGIEKKILPHNIFVYYKRNLKAERTNVSP